MTQEQINLFEKFSGTTQAEVSKYIQQPSWDFLMTVIEKIEMEGYIVHVSSGKTRIEWIRTPSSYPSFEAEVGGGLEDEKIEATIDCLSQFIEWWNDMKGLSSIRIPYFRSNA